MICCICKNESDKEPFDSSKPVYCSQCDPRNKCKSCGEKLVGYHANIDTCHKCKEKESKGTFKSKVRKGPLSIICNI